jgi:hypothetical protein
VTAMGPATRSNNSTRRDHDLFTDGREPRTLQRRGSNRRYCRSLKWVQLFVATIGGNPISRQ